MAIRPVSIIRGPANAVRTPIPVTKALSGAGSFPNTPRTFPPTSKTLAMILRNGSPISAMAALNVSNALLYLPDADSVKAFNSRSAIDPKSDVEAFIKSNTCSV